MTPLESTASNYILVMEDNPSDVYLLRRALDQHGVGSSIEVVRDGEQALELLDRT